MNYKILFTLTAVLMITLFISVGCNSNASGQQSRSKNTAPNTAPTPESKEKYTGEKITKTEAEWREQLTPEQFYVLREEGTEHPYTGKFTDNPEHGDYFCAACHLKVFNTDAQFHSGTGWVSFYKPAVAVNVTEKSDTTLGMTRTEIECSRCNSHLGHVFDDGPEPTGLRYCINSVALTFEKTK